jgi:hypothetical protein
MGRLINCETVQHGSVLPRPVYYATETYGY